MEDFACVLDSSIGGVLLEKLAAADAASQAAFYLASQPTAAALAATREAAVQLAAVTARTAAVLSPPADISPRKDSR